MNRQKQQTTVFHKKDVLKKFAIFIGKYLCRSLLLMKLQTFRPATLLKRESNTGFPENIAKVLRTTILKIVDKE